MGRIKKYNQFLILEKYDKNITKALIDMGVTDKVELDRQVALSKRGSLAKYLEEKGDVFTFGLLKAIFLDARNAKKVTDTKKRIFNILPVVIPLSLIPFFPTLAIISATFGMSRLFHRIFDIVFGYVEPNSKYSTFLKKMVETYMKLPEGEVNLKDRFSRAFVVSDRLIDAIKPEVIDKFTMEISDKMQRQSDDTPVPEHYIENELKTYLNYNFDINPEIPLK